MKFKDQEASAVKKANKTHEMIKRNFEYILIKSIWSVVWYVSETAIRICCASMVTISNWFERKIRAERRATKLVRNIKRKGYEDRLSILKLMSTLDRRDRADMIMKYNILNHRVEMDTRFMKMNTESRKEDIPRNSN